MMQVPSMGSLSYLLLSLNQSSILAGKGYENLKFRLPLASHDLTAQPIIERVQTQQAKPLHGSLPQPVKVLKEGTQGIKSKVIDGKPYRGVSQNGPNKYRAQICDRGRVSNWS